MTDVEPKDLIVSPITEADAGPGVYLLLCGKHAYVGSSKHLYKRTRQHLYCLARNRHYNRHMQAVFNKRGDDFSWFVLERSEAADRIRLVEAEAAWYDKCPSKSWMNASRPTLGSAMTEEIRLRIAASVKVFSRKMWDNGSIREKHRQSLLLVMSDPARRARISAAVAATKRQPEVYARLCEINREIASRPEFIAARRADMIAARSDPNSSVNGLEARTKLSESIKKVWEREGFKDTMRGKYAEAWQRPETRKKHAESAQRGTQRETAKLTDEAVRTIRAAHDEAKAAKQPMIALYAALSERFGVHSSLVQAVAKRRRWKHVV